MSATTPPAPPPAPAPSPGPIGESCPLCGAPLGAEQEWCLRCGAAARTRLAATPKWRTPVIALSAVIVLSLGALTAALVSLAGDSGTSVAGTVSVTTTAPAAALGAAGASSVGGSGAGVPGAATAGQDTPTVAAPGSSGGTASVKSAPNTALPSERAGAGAAAGVPGAGTGTGTGSGAQAGAGSATSTPSAGTPTGTQTSTTPSGAQAHKGKAMEKLLHAIERHGAQSQRQAAGAPAG